MSTTEPIDDSRRFEIAILDDITETLTHDPTSPEDTTLSMMSSWLVEHVFEHRIAWNSEFGWMAFHSGVWNRISNETITEIVRRAHDNLYRRFMTGTGGTIFDAIKIKQLLSSAKIRAVVTLLAGQVEIPASMFDQRPELLNTPTGVVDLRTLELLPHDPTHYFTKITNVGYSSGATHPDIDELLTCLPVEERVWMCDRMGQALIGNPPDEATMTLMVGFGANGKTSLLHAANLALGSFFGRIPVSVLSASAKTGPNDTMTLRGVRMAVIEEFPEGHTLSNRNLKEVIGTPVLQGRYLFKEFVEWRATHTLFVTTNELPRVDETDHGTWRRFDVVSFPYRYVNGSEPLVNGDKLADPQLLKRVLDNNQGQLEAFLFLLVNNAHERLLRGNTSLSPTQKMESDKKDWRERCDKIMGFISDCIEFDEKCHVSAISLHGAYVAWMDSQGNRPLSQSNFLAKFLDHQIIRPHNVQKKRIRAKQWETKLVQPHNPHGFMRSSPEPDRYTAIRGITFK